MACAIGISWQVVSPTFLMNTNSIFKGSARRSRHGESRGEAHHISALALCRELEQKNLSSLGQTDPF